MNKKQIIIILVVLIALITSLVVYFAIRKRENNTDNIINEVEQPITETDIETSEKFKEERKFDVLDVKNIQYINNGDIAILRIDFTNNTETATKDTDVLITFLDKNGNELNKLNGIVLATEPGETSQLSVVMPNEYQNAYEFSIEKILKNEKGTLE